MPLLGLRPGPVGCAGAGSRGRSRPAACSLPSWSPGRRCAADWSGACSPASACCWCSPASWPARCCAGAGRRQPGRRAGRRAARWRRSTSGSSPTRGRWPAGTATGFCCAVGAPGHRAGHAPMSWRRRCWCSADRDWRDARWAHGADDRPAVAGRRARAGRGALRPRPSRGARRARTCGGAAPRRCAARSGRRWRTARRASGRWCRRWSTATTPGSTPPCGRLPHHRADPPAGRVGHQPDPGRRVPAGAGAVVRGARTLAVRSWAPRGSSASCCWRAPSRACCGRR